MTPQPRPLARPPVWVRPEHFILLTLLNDGRVLIAGGQENSGPIIANGELYNPSLAGFEATGSMINSRVQFQATLLSDGKVLVTGGLTETGGQLPLTAAELYNRSRGAFDSTGNMLTPRTQHTSTLLSDGTVLVAGGGKHSPEQVLQIQPNFITHQLNCLRPLKAI